ncbi:MAG: FeoA family protein [Tissierellaceae bacterium]
MDYIPLTALRPREYARIKGITGCYKAKKRLYELGLYRDSIVKVVKNDFGPVILNLSGNKLALGRKLASKVMVESYVVKPSRR